ELEFARQNLNVAINAVFTPKIREAISAHGEDIYDHIHLGGVSAKTYFGDRFNDAENSEDLKKAEILKFIVNGGEVKIDLYNEKGELENIDCRAVSQDTAITALMQGNAGQPAAEEKEKLSEIFKQAVTFREQSFVREVDAGSDPEGYIELQKQKRAAGRKVEFLEAAIFSVDMNLADATDCLKRAVGEADAQKYIDDLYTESNFRIRVGAYIEKNKPELLQGMSKLEKSQFSTSLRIFNNRMTAWREQGLITQKEHDELVRQHVVFHGRALTGEQQTRFIDAVESKLSPKALEGIRKTIDSYKDVNEFSFEESVDNEQAAKIDALKNAAAAAGKKNEEYLAALEYASKHLVSQKPKVRQEKMEFDKDVAHLANLQSDKALNVTAPVYQNGKFSGIHTETEALQDLFVVKPGRENDFKDVMETDMNFSQTTKEGLLKIFRKMEEMELEAHHFAPSGEDGDKIYAFNKLWEERKAFENAINEGDEKKITDAYKAYEKTAGDMKQLFDMAKECFADDTVIHPANYDSVRNTKIPFEFTQDVRTSAQLNAVFVNYLLIKQKGLSFEQYLNAPAGTVINGIKEGIKQNSFAEKTKGLSLEESIDAMSGQGRFKNPMLGILNVAPNYMIPRVMEIPALLEKDKNIRQDNIVRSAVMCKVFANVNNSESSKYNYLTANRDNDISRRSKSRTLLNLILVSDKDRVLNSMLGSIPATDCFGSVTGPSFDTQAYIEKKPVDYEGILDRGERLIKKAREMQHGKVPGLTADEVLESMQQLYMQVMMTHSDEKDSEGYRKMREAFRRIPDRLSEEADQDLKDRIKIQTEGFAEANPESFKPKIWDDIDHARGYKFGSLTDSCLDFINDEEEKKRLTDIKSRALAVTIEQDDYIDRIQNIENYDGGIPGKNMLYGYNSSAGFKSLLRGEEAVEKSNVNYRDLLNALKKAGDRLKEPKAKRGIDDAMFMVQLDPQVYSKICAEHPYMANLIAQIAGGIDHRGNEERAEQIKKELGTVYDDMMDFLHYCHEEMRLECARNETVQKLKAEGKAWGAAEEAAYTEKLKEKHAALISCYDRIAAER
ncbi:MAG: hypothetical protein J5842_07605, partial [Lachnospiraceae bacterium]|nr:hypothetical protein [Lachnospiraceae bacterium]